MNYRLYTFPGCTKCQDVKKILDEKKVEYQEINAGIKRKEFNKFYNQNRESIQRDKDKQIVLPILEGNKEIFQGLEKIIEVSDKL